MITIKREKTCESVRPSSDPSTPSKSSKNNKKKKHKSHSDRTTPASQSIGDRGERPTPIQAGRLDHSRVDDRGRVDSSEVSHVKRDQRSKSRDGHSHRRKKDRSKRREQSSPDETPTHPPGKQSKKPHHPPLSASDPATIRSREVPDAPRESTNLSLPARPGSNNSALPNLVAREVNLGRTYDKVNPTAIHPDNAPFSGLQHRTPSQTAGSVTRQSSIAPPNFYHGVPRGPKAMKPSSKPSATASPRELVPQSKSACGKPRSQDHRSKENTVSDRKILAVKGTKAAILNRPNTPPVKHEEERDARLMPQVHGHSFIDLTQQTPPSHQATALNMASPSPTARRARHVTLPPSIPQKRKAVEDARPNEPAINLYDRSMKRLQAQRERNNEFIEEMENEMRLFKFQSLNETDRTSKHIAIHDSPKDRRATRNEGSFGPDLDDPGEGPSAPRPYQNASNRINGGQGVNIAASRSNVAPAWQESANQATANENVANVARRKKPTIAEQKQRKPEYSSDIPARGRVSDNDLIRIGKIRSSYGRHSAAPYAFSWHGRLRAAFKFLLTRQNADGSPAWTAHEIARIRR